MDFWSHYCEFVGQINNKGIRRRVERIVNERFSQEGYIIGVEGKSEKKTEPF